MLKEGCLLKLSRAHWLLGGQRCISAQTQNMDKAKAKHCGRVRVPWVALWMPFCHNVDSEV